MRQLNMTTLTRRACAALLVALLWQPTIAQRMVGGGLNYAPKPAVYVVVSVDSDEHTVELRAADGRTGTVSVAQDVFDLSQLKPGDKIRVDFLVPDGTDKSLKAASVWPEN